MNTRTKIVPLEQAAQIDGPVTVVTGLFDVLRAGHIHDLAAARKDGAKLVVVVLPALNECLPLKARSELVAALRVVDYVVTAPAAAADRLAAGLNCQSIVHLEAADAGRARELKEHVQRRQK
jgi:glycerol-3-phosphate cytidylyltransferase-like family protein